MSCSPAAKPAVGAGLSGSARTIALWVILLAFFMDLLDTTIVNVGDPVDPDATSARATPRSSGSSPATR